MTPGLLPLWLPAALLSAEAGMGARRGGARFLEGVQCAALVGAYPSPGLQLVIGAESGATTCRFQLFPVDSPVTARTRVAVTSTDGAAASMRVPPRPRSYLGANGCGEGSWARVAVIESSNQLNVIDATVAVAATSPELPLLFSIRSRVEIDAERGTASACARCQWQGKSFVLGDRPMAVRTDPLHADDLAVAQLCALTRVALDQMFAILRPPALRIRKLSARALPLPLGAASAASRHRRLQMHTSAPPYKRLRGCPKEDTYELDIGVVVDHGFVRGRRAISLSTAGGGEFVREVWSCGATNVVRV
tara:strand:- start:4923 stop:5840 length:918 start_codon:yes stop_codon:yes gene_type:complete